MISNLSSFGNGGSSCPGVVRSPDSATVLRVEGGFGDHGAAEKATQRGDAFGAVH